MKFRSTDFEGLYLIEAQLQSDERGSFSRLWCEEELRGAGLPHRITQMSLSHTKTRNTLRGMHFQRSPHGETKWIRCTRGSIFDVVIDLRKRSRTFKRHFTIELAADNPITLLVPAGFAHGFVTLTDDVEVSYAMDAPYVAAAASGVRWNDPVFQIPWPSRTPLLSSKDAAWPAFSDDNAL